MGTMYSESKCAESNMKYKIGDNVKLRKDVLVRHSRSVPARFGYTHEQFVWRDILDKLEGKCGRITRIFPNSNHVNVKFKLIGLIGISTNELKMCKK